MEIVETTEVKILKEPKVGSENGKSEPSSWTGEFKRILKLLNQTHYSKPSTR